MNRRPRGSLNEARKHPLFRVWENMERRCHYPKAKSFDNYGGRGITVCDRWRNDFLAFVADMGERPAGMTLERRNNDGNYEPSNCRWATRKEQNHNTRLSWAPITFNGVTKQIIDWERDLGFRLNNVRCRLLTGWSIEKALTTPPKWQRQGSVALTRLRVKDA